MAQKKTKIIQRVSYAGAKLEINEPDLLAAAVHENVLGADIHVDQCLYETPLHNLSDLFFHSMNDAGPTIERADRLHCAKMEKTCPLE